MAESLLILTEAGGPIGYGHLSRCSAIFDACKEMGINANILLDWHGENANPSQFKNVQWRSNTNVADADFSYVLVDSYKADLVDYHFLAERSGKLVVIDDYLRFSDFGADLIVNPNVYGDQLIYNAKAVGGNDYVILRKAFRTYNEKKAIEENVASLMVTLGGNDNHSLLPLFASAFGSLPFRFHFICGSNEYAELLQAEFSSEKYTFSGYVKEDEMLQAMLKADIVISACGQTLHELAYLGLPFIDICIGDDQLLNMKYYHKQSATPHLFWHTPDLDIQVLNAVYRFQSFKERKQFVDRNIEIIDGKGVDRIINLIFRS